MRSRVDRQPRLPFFGPVVVGGLGPCWATNVGPGGLGLTAHVAGAPVPRRGDELELDLALEGHGSIGVLGRVAWTGAVRPDGRVALGVQFCELAASARTVLAMFLAGHRPRVLVAHASAVEQALAATALAGLHVERIEVAGVPDAELLRSCASLVVFGDDGAQVRGFVAAVGDVAAASAHAGDIPPAPITLCGDLDPAVVDELIAAGAVYQALRPPFPSAALGAAVERACERWALQLEVRWSSWQLEGLAARPAEPRGRPSSSPPPTSSAIVRESTEMRRVYDLIATVAVHDVPVLLIGETGTGKELAAREIHARSKRAKTPFVTQDCGALTETLLESELFGHVRGAFTGAASDHPGLFQIADRGTIFLDEIQNTSPALQAKLLRVVEQGEVRPVGGARSRPVDVRLIVACNVDLRQAVKEQRFRADFFYRLNRFPIELPPLREHRDDVLPLAHFFLARLGDGLGRGDLRLDPRVARALTAYDWPGNIRELRNAIERAVLLTSPGEPIRCDALPAEVVGATAGVGPPGRGLDAQVARFERALIEATLERHDGVIRRAARELAVNAVTLARRMRRLGLVERRARPRAPTP